MHCEHNPAIDTDGLPAFQLYSATQYGVRVHYVDGRAATEEWAVMRDEDPTGWVYAWTTLKPFHEFYNEVDRVEVIQRPNVASDVHNPRGYRHWIETLIRRRESVTLFRMFDYQFEPAGPVNAYGVFYTSGTGDSE